MKKFGILLMMVLGFSAVSNAAVYADRMFAFAGQTLNVGDSLYSANTRYYLTMQSDCNLVVYEARTVGQPRPLWDSKTQFSGPGCRAVMQTDGNLVVYDRFNSPVFNTGTQGKLNAVLVMQTDGNLVIYENYRLTRALWNAGSQQP